MKSGILISDYRLSSSSKENVMRVAWVKKWGMGSILGILIIAGFFATQSLFPVKVKSHEVQAELSKFSQTLRTSPQASKYVLTESDRSLLQKQGLLKSAQSPALSLLLQ